MPVAGWNLLGRENLHSPNFFWEISNLAKFVYCVHSLGLWSEFINPPNIWTALFEKETYDEKPPRLKSRKMPKIWKKNPLKWVLSISRDYLFYFEKVPQNLNSERVCCIERLYLWSCDFWCIERLYLWSCGASRDFIFDPAKIWSCDQRQSSSPVGVIRKTRICAHS